MNKTRILPPSVSAGQTGLIGMTLREASQVDSGQSRLRYNSDEFRGLLRHVAVQTEMHASALDGVEAGSQVDFASEALDELEAIKEQIFREREKANERERLLIAQMNALRGGHTDEGKKLSIRVRVVNVQIEVKGLAEYDKVWLDVGNDAQIPFGVFKTDPVGRIVEIREGQGWFGEFEVDRDIVNLALVCIVRATSSNSGSFPLIMGQTGFPPFTPSIKERGKPEIVTLHFPNLGDINTELVIT